MGRKNTTSGEAAPMRQASRGSLSSVVSGGKRHPADPLGCDHARVERPGGDAPPCPRFTSAGLGSAPPRAASRPFGITGLLAAVFMVAAVAPATLGQNQGGQRTPPHIGYAYPAGGRQGTTFTVSIGGQNLAGTTDAYCSSPAITARVAGYDRPLTQKEFNDLRDQIQALQQKRAAATGMPLPARAAAKESTATDRNDAARSSAPGDQKTDAPRPVWTADDEAEIRRLRAQLAKRPNRQGNPAIAETVTLEVAIAPDAEPRDCELRLKTPAGISNPILFQVGQLPEITPPVVTPTNQPVPPPPRAGRDDNARIARMQPADRAITLPAVVNGQILPGEVDRYRFAATKGQHLTIAVSARGLIPYLADAVPGWFQATIALYDPQGREVAYADSFRFSPDPVVTYEIGADGEHVLAIKDSIYRGREDFVYRVAIGELPFVTGIFPLGGSSAANSTFELAGWNLPGRTLTLDAADKSPGAFVLAVQNRGQLSNAVRVALDAEPAIREREPNETAAAAQTVTLPLVVDGRIDRAGDVDMFRFDGKAGAIVVAEAYARRLGSPLDSVLELTDAGGRRIAFNDDNEDKGAGLTTHHADSRLQATLPADGTYYLRLADTQHHGGPEYAYRLHVGPPQPDFELRVVPSSINARAGAHVPVTVYALRRDGFAGEIALALRAAPPGFTLSGARIPAGQDKIQLTLAAPIMAQNRLVPLTFTGNATVDGHSTTRVAVPAEDMMQAFAYHHLVPAQTLVAYVGARGGPGGARLATRATVLQIPAGGTVQLKIETTVPRAVRNITAELDDAPDGFAIVGASTHGDTVEVTLSCDAAKVKPGTQGNLVVNLFGERTNPNAPTAQQRTQRIPLGTAPAVPFEVTTGPKSS